MDAPERVQQVHEAYIHAGARIILANTYSVTRCRFSKSKMSGRFGSLNRLACEVARQVRDCTDPSVLIAGSLPPCAPCGLPDRRDDVHQRRSKSSDHWRHVGRQTGLGRLDHR
jgi:methionine synthase I (cobalamin-dependent)